MKKTVLIISLIFATSAFSKLNIIVSISPEVEFVQKIGGDKVETFLMVESGSSPHTYEPKPSQMRILSKAKLYLAIGVEFEKSWLNRFQSQNRDLKIIDISKDIKRIDNNPHIWTAPHNVKIIANNIFEALSSNDKENREYYRENLKQYLKEIDSIDKKIRETLTYTPKGCKFMVFHPAWGYFANEYNLEELAIEIDGKAPKPRELIDIIKKARAENIKVLFTQPEFSDKTAQIIAKTLKLKVIKISPLAKNWGQNLIKLAKAIAYKETK
jgi:zinc transport system substrate-binding protein